MFKTSQIIRTLVNRCGAQSIVRNRRRHHSIGSVFVKNVIVFNSPNLNQFNCCNRSNRLFSTMTSPVTAFVGRKAPEFAGMLVENGQFREIRSEHYFKQNRFVVLLFYPMDFTFVCPTEILAFDDRLADFNRLNCDVIGVSCDSHFCHLAWTKTERREGGLAGLKMPLLADKNAAIAKSYGVYLDDKGIALRGLFIIDAKGVLRQIIVNDLPVGRSVDEALRLVEAIQFTDKHGEVCPAGWKPGKKTMIPDPVKSLDYFNAAN